MEKVYNVAQKVDLLSIIMYRIHKKNNYTDNGAVKNVPIFMLPLTNGVLMKLL